MRVFTQNAASAFPEFDVMVVLGFKRGQNAAYNLGYDIESGIGGEAYTQYDAGDNKALVVIGKRCLKYDKITQYGLYAHEAVHCMQAWAKSIGEDDCGEEEQAYMVQACFDAICNGLEEEVKKHGKKVPKARCD